MNTLQLSTRLSALAAASLVTLCIQGAVLLGADRLATDGAARWAATQNATTLVAQKEIRHDGI